MDPNKSKQNIEHGGELGNSSRRSIEDETVGDRDTLPVDVDGSVGSDWDAVREDEEDLGGQMDRQPDVDPNLIDETEDRE